MKRKYYFKNDNNFPGPQNYDVNYLYMKNQPKYR